MEIKGEVQDIIYKNEINSYTIATFKTSEEETTVVGYLPFINSGDTLKVNGVFIEHQEYGRQFKIETFEKIMPQTLDALERYLANGTIKGIGPATAKKIVGTFGEETINIFKFEPKMLSNIKGITEEKAISIAEEFIANWEIWQLVGFLDKFGVGPQSAEKIYKTLGTNAIEEIEANPYILVDLVNKVDFTQIDKMALGIGIEYNNDKRIKSGIKHALRLSTYNGHSTVAYENLVQFVSTLLGVNGEYVEENIINLKAKNEIIIEERENGEKLEEWVYLEEFYNAEKNIANKLISLKEGRNIKKINGFDRKIKTLEKHSDIELSEKQLEAVRAINDNNVCVITGRPGTGKTTIINAIVKLFIKENKYNKEEVASNIILLAPTGKAAKKLSLSTGLGAQTIHRLLRWHKEEDSFEFNEHNKLFHKLVIVDECSMIDVSLMKALLCAYNSNIKLVLVGDIYQLPSVGPGLVLHDLIESDLFSFNMLSTIYRQSDNSYIPFLAKDIKAQNLEDDFTSKRDDYSFIITSEDKILETVIKCVNYGLTKGIDETKMQVLAPMYKGINGIDNLNKYLEKVYNKEKNLFEVKYGDKIYRVGDKVLQLVNDSDNNVFNGDIGKITNIYTGSDDKLKISIDFDGNLVFYEKKDLKNITLAYAITIHKSQGSEFEHVIMPLSKDYSIMLYNKLIYTGVSRAKKSLTIIGDPSSFIRAVSNNYSKERRTSLKEFLQSNYDI